MLGVGFHGCHISIFLTHFCMVPLYAEALQSALTSSLGGIALYVGVDSVYLWEEMGSGSSYDAVLDLPLRLIFFMCNIKFTY